MANVPGDAALVYVWVINTVCWRSSAPDEGLIDAFPHFWQQSCWCCAVVTWIHSI